MKHASLLLMVSVAFAVLTSPVPLQAQQPPQWLQDLNPADYALLAADLAPGLTFRGEINAEARAVEIGMTDAQGRTTMQQTVHFALIQAIDVAEGDETGIVSIYIAVFATPDETIAFTREHFGDYGMNPDWMVNANELGDRRIPPNGGSVAGAGRAIIRYRNMVASFSWNGRIDDFGTQKTVQVARLWLNKVAGPPGADLHLNPDRIWIKHWADYQQIEREPAADRQYVMAQITNNSPDVTAENVRARISVQRSGEFEYTRIGEPLVVGSIAPGQSSFPIFEWDLQGENVIGAALLIDAWSEGAHDADPRDNQAGIEVSIYYSHNGSSAYRWLEDSYQFGNYGFPKTDTAELVQGLLATVVGQLYTDPQAADLLNRLLFPQTYTGFFDYLHRGMESGAGGHCYGMSATAGLYFMDHSLRPSASDTWNLTPATADANIKLYQRAQMVPIAQALISGKTYFDTNWGGVNCLNTVRQILRDERRPLILVMSGTKKVQEQVMVDGQPQQQTVDKTWGHAVLAYKLAEITGRSSVVYVYDPNVPPMQQWHGQAPMSAFAISPEHGGFTTTSDMTPLYNREATDPRGEMTLSWIAARGVTREVSLAEANLIVPELKAKLKEMTDFLERGSKFIASLRCPADVVFTDPQGRRVGQIGDTQVNEIPGAEIRASGDVEIYILPSDREYSLTITGNGSGTAALDIIRPVGGEPALTSFQNMSVSAGSTLSATMAPGAAIDTISGGGTTHAPTMTGALSGDRVTWEQPAGPTAPTAPTAPTIPGVSLVICSDQENGNPIGAADSFARPPHVYGVLTYTNVPDATATYIWMRDGAELHRGETQITGDGWAWARLYTDAAEGLRAGHYELVWQFGGNVLAQRAFTITERAAAQPPYVTPAPPTTPAAQTWVFDNASSSREAPALLPTVGGELSLEFRYSQPGSILDTVGILAAPDGSFCLSIYPEGLLMWQIMNRQLSSAYHHPTGWHYMQATTGLPPGQWHSVRVTWGPGGMKLFANGQLLASDPAVLSLADIPAYFGDFPADGRPMGFTGEIRNVGVAPWQGGEG